MPHVHPREIYLPGKRCSSTGGGEHSALSRRYMCLILPEISIWDGSISVLGRLTMLMVVIIKCPAPLFQMISLQLLLLKCFGGFHPTRKKLARGNPTLTYSLVQRTPHALRHTTQQRDAMDVSIPEDRLLTVLKASIVQIDMQNGSWILSTY